MQKVQHWDKLRPGRVSVVLGPGNAAQALVTAVLAVTSQDPDTTDRAKLASRAAANPGPQNPRLWVSLVLGIGCPGRPEDGLSPVQGRLAKAELHGLLRPGLCTEPWKRP